MPGLALQFGETQASHCVAACSSIPAPRGSRFLWKTQIYSLRSCVTSSGSTQKKTLLDNVDSGSHGQICIIKSFLIFWWSLPLCKDVASRLHTDDYRSQKCEFLQAP